MYSEPEISRRTEEQRNEFLEQLRNTTFHLLDVAGPNCAKVVPHALMMYETSILHPRPVEADKLPVVRNLERVPWQNFVVVQCHPPKIVEIRRLRLEKLQEPAPEGITLLQHSPKKC